MEATILSISLSCYVVLQHNKSDSAGFPFDILCVIDLNTTGLAFSNPKYAWLGIDWTQILCLDKMGVAKPFSFFQVTIYLKC